QIAHPLLARHEVFRAQEPAHVAPPEAFARTVHVELGVGITVMTPMMRCPPDRAALRRGRTEQAEKKLAYAAGSKSLVRKITVIERSDREHTNEIRKQRHPKHDRAPAH